MDRFFTRRRLPGNFLVNDVEETVFPLLGALGSDGVAKQYDSRSSLAFGPQCLQQASARQPAAVAIVGSDVFDGQFRVFETGIDDHDGNTLLDRSLNWRDHRLAVLRCDDDPADAPADLSVHDADLREGVALAQRAIPNHFDVDAVAGMEVVGRTHGATVDRLPELVRHSLWNDGNPIIGRNALAAGGRQRED